MKTNDRKSAIKKLSTLVFSSKSEVVPFRQQIEKTFKTVIIPNNVEKDDVTMGGVHCDFLVPEIYSQERVIVYVHGGFFIGGSCKSYRGFCASIANASTTKVYLPEIRLAPENPFPAALEDVTNLIKSITDKEIILMADGSGASIALGCVYSMSLTEKQKIKEIILFSPCLDYSPDGQLYTQKKAFDEVLSAEDLRRSADYYTYHSNQKNPFVSSILANDQMLENFPEVFIQNGEKELQTDLVRSFAHLMYSHDIKCTVDTWPDMMFMFQMADEFLPQAHLAIEKIGMHIQDREF